MKTIFSFKVLLLYLFSNKMLDTHLFGKIEYKIKTQNLNSNYAKNINFNGISFFKFC